MELDDEAEAMRVAAGIRKFAASWFGSYLESQGLRDDDAVLRASWRRLHLRRLDPTTGPGPDPLTADRAWALPLLALTVSIGRRVRRGRRD